MTERRLKSAAIATTMATVACFATALTTSAESPWADGKNYYSVADVRFEFPNEWKMGTASGGIDLFPIIEEYEDSPVMFSLIETTLEKANAKNADECLAEFEDDLKNLEGVLDFEAERTEFLSYPATKIRFEYPYDETTNCVMRSMAFVNDDGEVGYVSFLAQDDMEKMNEETFDEFVEAGTPLEETSDSVEKTTETVETETERIKRTAGLFGN